MILVATAGLWSGSTAALHIEDQSKTATSKVELVKIELPVFMASISKKGEPPTFIRAHYSVSIPSKHQANPALLDMLSDALLRSTVQTFTNPTEEHLKIPQIAANKIANMSNGMLDDVEIDELHVSELAIYKYMR